MSEKISEINLDNELCIFKKHFPEKIYYTPFENKALKTIFSKASKRGNNIGIPDRIIFCEDKHVLIVFECKSEKCGIHNAMKDLSHYKEKIIECENYDIYLIGFVNRNIYKIFSVGENKVIEISIHGLIQKLFGNELYINDINDINNKLFDKKRDKLGKMYMEKQIHSIHNYIRDNTKISDEDKPFFISIILISIKKPIFRDIIKNYIINGGKYIYDILSENIREFDLDITIFNHFRNDINNKHFLTLIQMVLAIINDEISIDLLNLFYHEFVRYNNSDSKSLGIVLTPDHIVKLMVYLLDIKENDIILDICSGTGSFLLKSLGYNPQKIIACEYQTKLYTLLKCNFILRDIPKEKYTLIKDDCFLNDFKSTKSIINPPYGMKDKTELDFILKQLESLENMGLAVSIIPISNIKRNNEKRRKILGIGKIKIIIICNEKLFYPMAGVKCCILLIEKNIEGHLQNDPVKIINYNNDGFIMKRTFGRIKGEKYDEIYEKIIDEIDSKNNLENNEVHIDMEGDWVNMDIISEKNEVNILSLKTKLNEVNFYSELLKLSNTITNPNKYYKFSKKFHIEELFTISKTPIEEYRDIGKIVNVISAKNNSNGIKEKIPATIKTFYGNKIVLVTGGDGGAGLAYYQRDDFMIVSATICLIPINIKLDEYIGIYIANELCKYKQIYSRGYSWSLEKIKRDIITIPFNPNKNDINYSYIRKLFN